MGKLSIDDLSLDQRRVILKINYYDLLVYADMVEADYPERAARLREAAERVHVRYAEVSRELGVEDDIEVTP